MPSAPPPETRQSRFEQSVALSLGLWPALTLAVQNNWGGADSADKRDWFAGVIAEAFPSFATPTTTSSSTTAAAVVDEPDTEYIEELLLQIMLDEFEVAVDDDSSFDVAAELIRLRGQCRAGNFEEVERLEARWTAAKGRKVVMEAGAEKDQDTEGSESEGDDSDEEMEDAPGPAEPRERREPEVDEDGFTKVTKKR